MTGRVLIVDDNNLNRMVLGRQVREQGHEVAMADGGRAALEMLEAEAFDVVLLDVLMPEMDGYQVLEAIMADPDLKHIPVIMVSALDEMDSVIRCIELGAQDYLPKPANALLLKARINASLVKKRMHDLERRYVEQVEREKKRADDLLNVVIPIGAALSGEQDFGALLDRILNEAMSICHASGGVLYLRTEDDRMEVVTARFLGRGADPAPALGASIPLAPGRVEHAGRHPIEYIALTYRAVNVADSYNQDQYDFTDLHRFDEATGGRSVSVLALPLRSASGKVIGVVQLINARDPRTGEVVPFDAHLEQMMTSLSTLAAVALEHYRREQRLKQEIEVLRIEIDAQREARAVAELTETDFFRRLEAKTDVLRRRLEEAGGRTHRLQAPEGSEHLG